MKFQKWPTLIVRYNYILTQFWNDCNYNHFKHRFLRNRRYWDSHSASCCHTTMTHSIPHQNKQWHFGIRVTQLNQVLHSIRYQTVHNLTYHNTKSFFLHCTLYAVPVLVYRSTLHLSYMVHFTFSHYTYCSYLNK